MNTRTIIEQYKQRQNILQRIRETGQVQLYGESMFPILNPKETSVLFVKNRADYKVGDIVVFKYEHSLFGVAVHRIIKKSGRTVTTKGDNNLRDDGDIDISDVIGKVEKVLTVGSSIAEVKSSKFVAMLSRFERRAASVCPKRISVFFHRVLIKMYGLVAQKR